MVLDLNLQGCRDVFDCMTTTAAPHTMQDIPAEQLVKYMKCINMTQCECFNRCECAAAERPAQNERAYDDSQAAMLYKRTGEILSDKISSFDAGRKWV